MRHPTPTLPVRGRNRKASAVALAVAGALVLALPAAHAAHQPPADTTGSATAGQQDGGSTVDLQILAINDFHGALEPPEGSNGQVIHEHADGGLEEVDAGGVEYLASALREARAGRPSTATVAAGDLVGASPLLSGLFHDEPTVEALNQLGMDIAGVGNHEFDEGWEELLRLQDGGCHPEDGCFAEGRSFDGAAFPFLAANVVHEDSGEPILPPYTVREMAGVEVGFIGVTLEGTDGIVVEEGIRGLEFLNEADTINRYTEELADQGVHAVIALIHEGGFTASPAYNSDCDADGGQLSGPVVDIAKRVDAGVDALITGHTHQPYVCTVPDPRGNDRLVTSAASNGRLFTELTMEYDTVAQDIVRTSVAGANRVVDREREPASDLTALLAYWNDLAGPVAGEPVGWILEDIAGRGASTLESPLGALLADAQLAQARDVDERADLALMNPGGIRADLVYEASGDEGDGVVTYGEAFTVQPFSNTVNLLDLTGAQLLSVLREQVSGGNEERPTILQVSEGLTYTLDLRESGADRIAAGSVTVHGEPLAPERTYRVVANAFLAGGGDGFPTLAEGGDPLVVGEDTAALVDYLSAGSAADDPLGAPSADRITIIE